MQFKQCFAATNLFQFAVCRLPLHPFAYTERQSAPRHRRIGFQDFCNPSDHRRIEFPAIQAHVAYIASFTHSVKCVPQSGQSRRLEKREPLKAAPPKMALKGPNSRAQGASPGKYNPTGEALKGRRRLHRPFRASHRLSTCPRARALGSAAPRFQRCDRSFQLRTCPAGLLVSTPGTVKRREFSSRAGGFPKSEMTLLFPEQLFQLPLFNCPEHALRGSLHCSR